MGISHGNPVGTLRLRPRPCSSAAAGPRSRARCFGYWRGAHVAGTPFYDRFTEAAGAEAQATMSAEDYERELRRWRGNDEAGDRPVMLGEIEAILAELDD